MSALPLSIVQLSVLATVVVALIVTWLSWLRRQRSHLAKGLLDHALANRNLASGKLSDTGDQERLREAQHRCAQCKSLPRCAAALSGSDRADSPFGEDTRRATRNASSAPRPAILSSCPNRLLFDALTRKHHPDTMRRLKIDRARVHESVGPH